MDNTVQQYNHNVETRLNNIREKLHEAGYVDVMQLSESMKVSLATIRRDLQILEEMGECTRKHGGAIPVQTSTKLELPYDEKIHQNVNEKRKIAEAAFELVKDGDSLLIDSGSTTFELVKLLPKKEKLLVATNDLLIATHLAQFPHIRLIMLGGIVTSQVYSVVGDMAEQFIRTCFFDRVFIGSDAVHEDGVISNTNLSEVTLKQSMIKAGRQVVLLADSSKFSRIGFKAVCNVSDIDIVITDSNINSKSLRMLEQINVNLIITK
ncbi:MAG: DeoR/GlpR family DNA-binding transcription regulator [Flexilinea sp.]